MKYFFLDYVRTGLSSLTFTSSGTRNIPVAIVDDGIVEGSEFFTISLFNAQPSTVVLNPDTVTVTILDNDDSKFSRTVSRHGIHTIERVLIGSVELRVFLQHAIN